MLPLNASEKLTQFLVGAQNSKALVEKLNSNKSFLIEFFKSAANDSAWMQSHPQVMKKLIKLIDQHATQGMTGPEAREITQLAKAKLDPNSPLIKEDVTLEFETDHVTSMEIDETPNFRVQSPQSKSMSHFLLGAASSTFANMIEFSQNFLYMVSSV